EPFRPVPLECVIIANGGRKSSAGISDDRQKRLPLSIKGSRFFVPSGKENKLAHAMGYDKNGCLPKKEAAVLENGTTSSCETRSGAGRRSGKTRGRNRWEWKSPAAG